MVFKPDQTDSSSAKKVERRSGKKTMLKLHALILDKFPFIDQFHIVDPTLGVYPDYKRTMPKSFSYPHISHTISVTTWFLVVPIGFLNGVRAIVSGPSMESEVLVTYS